MASLSIVMLCVGNAIAEVYRSAHTRECRLAGSHLALNETSIAFEASCFPLPNFSLAFYSPSMSIRLADVPIDVTEKSAAFSFRFLELFGIFYRSRASPVLEMFTHHEHMDATSLLLRIEIQ